MPLFYGYSGSLPLLFLIFSVLWSYFCARSHNKKWAIWIAISFPLAVLFVFKYLGFSLDLLGIIPGNNSLLAGLLSISMPAGISFYTFQIVSYSVDKRDGKFQDETGLLRLMTYISFFPQLIAGPIIRYNEIKQQLSRIAETQTLKPEWSRALKFFSIGLFFKIFAADIPRGFQEKLLITGSDNSLDYVFSVISYSFVIYYDFWSYSLMAIGLAAMFTISLPRNFLEPYHSRDPKDFWRRWHVTLSFWLRDYVYLRLGGNRSYIRNIAIVFISCGIWHGAGTNFIVWGAYHAILVIGYHFSRRFWDRLPCFVATGLTFLLVTLGWPLFYLDIQGYAETLQMIAQMNTNPTSIYGLHHIGYVALVAAFTFLVREDKWLFNKTPSRIFDNVIVHAGMALSRCLLLLVW